MSPRVISRFVGSSDVIGRMCAGAASHGTSHLRYGMIEPFLQCPCADDIGASVYDKYHLNRAGLGDIYSTYREALL